LNQHIAAAIEQAQVFLLLISPSTIAGGYINDREYPAIDGRRRTANALGCPIILMPCAYQAAIRDHFKRKPQTSARGHYR